MTRWQRRIYPKDLVPKETTEFPTVDSYLDTFLNSIDNDHSTYDKRDKFDFHIVTIS
jgi:hypothetical protein